MATKKTTKRSRGLGDTVKKVTDATGISAAVEFLFGKDCGCKERQERLNKLWKYKVLDLTADEYVYLKDLFKDLKNIMPKEHQARTLKIYQRVINPKQQMTSCTGCWSKIISQLKSLVREYDNEFEQRGG